MIVYVVINRFLLGVNIHGIFEDEADALREATAKDLPQGVLRRSVEPTQVIKKKDEK